METNMKNKEYTKINLRDFRHNLTQLKDSLVRIYEKGIPIGCYIPEQYEVKIESKQEIRREQMRKALQLPLGHLATQKHKNIDANEEFKKIMIEKYKKRNKRLSGKGHRSNQKKEQSVKEWEEMLSMPIEKSKLPVDFDVDKEYRRLLEQKYRK